jgi:hypothetical protein
LFGITLFSRYATAPIEGVKSGHWTVKENHQVNHWNTRRAAALTPMAAWLLNRLVVSGGQLAISNYDLIGFLLSARGIAFLLLSLAFILALWHAEQVGLMIIALGACLDRKTSVSFALRENIVRLPELIRLGILQAACYGAACLPFAGGAALTYWLLLGDRDINYYLTFRPWNWYVALNEHELAPHAEPFLVHGDCPGLVVAGREGREHRQGTGIHQGVRNNLPGPQGPDRVQEELS